MSNFIFSKSVKIIFSVTKTRLCPVDMRYKTITGEIYIRDAFLSCQTDLLLLKAAAVRKQKMAFLLCLSLFLMALFLMPPTELTQ